MASPSWIPSALLLAALAIYFGAVPGNAQLPPCTLTYATTAPLPLEFGVADRQGFFRQFGVVPCPRNVLDVNDVLAALKNKTADFAYEHTDNALSWYLGQNNFTAQVFAGGLLGGEVGLAVNRRNNVTGYVDVAGRAFLVDSTTSGLVTDLWKIAELNGINRGTFSPAASPSAQARYDYLVAGRTPTGQTVFGAMLEAPFWNLAKNVSDILLLNRIGEVVSPIQSTVYVLDRTRKTELNAKMVNLTAALIKANLYIYNATNKAAVISFIQTNNVLNPAVAADYYQSYVDGIQGSVYALQLSLAGTANTIAVRQNYDPTIRNENANLFVQPSTGTFYDDQIYKAAYALATQR
ncbi:hypothetical protein KFL_000050510 [Klebsormidium nitens]|uniref:SsuA/THI5-like domain-containing protein n=1 Tax=Klebsormidium nitens TaxID=105231 RepID=A0A1Y1HHH1_KLENI|nr:hypothetical protein KFL_000050510 [Klebsormidium nitens]|eukprot:GAQ77915.1 hypothetical protein KFL_000050510 [Klebsormidium nitens]